jgi:hypothetical protein
MEREEQPRDSPWYESAEAFVLQFHDYMLEKFLRYKAREFSSDDPCDYIEYWFPDVPRKLYRELVLPEAKYLAKKHHLMLRYSTLPMTLAGVPFRAHGEIQVIVPEDFYLSDYAQAGPTPADEVLDNLGHPFRYKNGGHYESREFTRCVGST